MINSKILEELESLGVTDIREYGAGATDTAENASKTLNVEVGAIAKSILVKTVKDEKYYMIVVSGDKKLSSPKMKTRFNCKTSFASLDDTFKLTGYSFGGVCPFAIDNNIEIIIDKSLSSFDYLYT